MLQQLHAYYVSKKEDLKLGEFTVRINNFLNFQKNYPYIFNILKESLDSASHYFELLLKVKRMNMNYISPSYIKSKCNMIGVMIMI